MAVTENATANQTAGNRTFDADHITGALEKEKNIKEAQFELSYDLGHMSSADFNKIYQKVRGNIQDWNNTHAGGDALGQLQLFDSKGQTVTDASKAIGIKFTNDTTQTNQLSGLEHRPDEQQSTNGRKETKGDTTTTYDVNGNRTSTDIAHANGTSEHREFDPKTGNVISTDIKYQDGTRDHTEIKYDIVNGKRVSIEYQDHHGGSGIIKYDPGTGNPEYQFRTAPDGSTEETSYDPSSGHVQSVLSRDEHGEITEMIKYNPITQNPAYHFKRTDDGSVEEEYDSHSGQIRSRIKTNDDGTSEHEEYDPSTGSLKSIDKKNADNSTEHTEYDSFTKNPVSYQKKDENGNVVEERKFDPGTGEPPQIQPPIQPKYDGPPSDQQFQKSNNPIKQVTF
jgi:hypothetical protein